MSFLLFCLNYIPTYRLQAYYSPSQKKIRADGSASDGLFSSLFDFGNVSAQGIPSNTQLLFTGGVKHSQSSCFSDLYVHFSRGVFLMRDKNTCITTNSVVPGEMLFTPDVLNTTQAVFIGIQQDSLYGPLNAWQFLVRCFWIEIILSLA